MATRSLKDEPKSVLRRGMAEHGWHSPSEPIQTAYEAPAFQFPPLKAPTWRDERWVRLGLVAAAMLLGTSLFLTTLQASFKGFEATGFSMEPTLHNGDSVIVNQLAYAQIDFGLLDGVPLIDPGGRWNSPARGDIVVLQSPISPEKELVKRVIGLPGERVEIKNGLVYINGAPLDEPYAAGETECWGLCEWEVPGGHYFVLGDNRPDSSDSRDGWTVPIDKIDGKKIFDY